MKESKICIVTGGSKGIGQAAVEALLAEEHKVANFDVDPPSISVGNENYRYYPCDVSKEREVVQAVQVVLKDFGGIDVLVNNAGIQRYSSVTETTEEEWDLVMNVNLKSAFLCAKHTIPQMQIRGEGLVINVSSVQAFITQQKVAPYTTSKTALLGLTRSIAVDYAPIVRSVAVCPGTIDTPMLREAIQQSPDPEEVLKECEEMHLVKRVGMPEEVGALIAFLAGGKANFFNGQALRIDGGLGILVGGSKRD